MPRSSHLLLQDMRFRLSTSSRISFQSLIPDEVIAEYRAIASEAEQRPRSKGAAIIIIAIWIFGAAMLGWVGFAHWGRLN